MKTNNIKLTVMHSHTSLIVFDVHIINKYGLTSPILWCRKGEFRLMPNAIIENLIANAKMYASLDSAKTTNPQLGIMWPQGIPISNQVGRALLGE